MHYVITEREQLNGAFPKLKELTNGKVVLPLSAVSRLRISLKGVDILNENDALKIAQSSNNYDNKEEVNNESI